MAVRETIKSKAAVPSLRTILGFNSGDKSGEQAIRRRVVVDIEHLLIEDRLVQNIQERRVEVGVSIEPVP